MIWIKPPRFSPSSAASRAVNPASSAIATSSAPPNGPDTIRAIVAATSPLMRFANGRFALAAVEAAEAAAGLGTPAPYRDFEPKVRAIVSAFRAWLDAERAAGRRVAAYGAAAKGNTFLNAARVTRDEIVCVADRNPVKQNTLLPGSHIPVVSPEALLAARPDDVLILPWNIASEIAGELQPVREWGGHLLVAVPDMRAV